MRVSKSLWRVVDGILMALFVGCLLYGQTASAEGNESLDAAQTLEAQGKEFLKKGDLRSAATALMAASRLHPQPATLMRLVSLYADLGRAQKNKNVNCEDVTEALTIFFKRCDLCRASTEKSCRVCRFVAQSPDHNMGRRAYALSQSFEKTSREAAVKAAQTPGVVGQKLLRKSEGLRTKSQDLRICLGRLAVYAQPDTVALRLDGRPIPINKEVYLLEGEHRLEARADGFIQESRPLRINGGQLTTMRLKLAPKRQLKAAPVAQSQNRPSQTDLKPSLSKSVTPRSSRGIWGWSVFGVGAASVVTGVVFLGAAHSAFDDANDARQLNAAQAMLPGNSQLGRAINERLSSDELEKTYNSRKADSERYEVAGIITGSIGIVGIGVGLWLALTGEESTSSAWTVGPQGIGWATSF